MSNLKFLVGYLTLIIPTYVLPYFGSNSLIVNGLTTAAGWGPTPMWWAHVWCIAMLIIITQARGHSIAKSFLPAFPLAAGIFDLVPLLSSIPLVPTVMHIIAIAISINGARTNTEVVPSSKNRLYAAALASVIAVSGAASFVISGTSNEQARENRPPSLPSASAPETPSLSPEATPATVQVERKVVTAKKQPRHEKHEPTEPKPDKPVDSGTTVRYMKL